MPDSYDALIASAGWQADLLALNRCLVDSLVAAGEPPVIGGNPFYRHMQQDSILTSKYMTRNDRKRRRLFDIARLGRTLFEIGVNGGHGLLLQKSANPALSCTGLDLCETSGFGNPRADIYCPAAMDWLARRFPGDMRFLVGNSADLLPGYVRDHAGPAIDILRIDGARANYHSDFMALRPLLHAGSLVVFDEPRWPVARAAVERAMAEGPLVPDPRFSQPETLFDEDAVMRLA